MPTSKASFTALKSCLEERLRIIADHAWRDRDASSHLEALRRVSLELESEHQRLKGSLPARLEHFLSQASYQKALDFISAEG